MMFLFFSGPGNVSGFFPVSLVFFFSFACWILVVETNKWINNELKTDKDEWLRGPSDG